MSYIVRGSDSGAELEWEICHARVPDPLTASLDDVHMVTADSDDVGTFGQQPHIRTLNDTELPIESSSYPTPADSSTGIRSDPCKLLIENLDTRSPSPVSLEPNLAPVVAAAMGLTGRAISERAGWVDCNPTSQSAWTSRQDEQFLYLCDIAQLNWSNIISYFPGMTSDAVKGRYKYLNGSKMTYQTVGDEPKLRLQMCKQTTYLASLTSHKAAKKCRAAPSRTKSRKQPISTLPEHYGTPTRRRVTKQAKPTKYVASFAVATHEDICQRTSRCGRPIRHPFRHLASEGYF